MVDLDEFLPHRDRMRLVDRVLEADESGATTESIVTDRWPLCRGDEVLSLVIVELVAQSASICVGVRRRKRDPNAGGGRGWLVGIKGADFAVPHVAVGARITVRVAVDFSFDQYTGIRGEAQGESGPIGAVRLQVMQAPTDSLLPAKR